MVGQRGVVDQLRVALDAAFEDGKRLDDCLLVGPPGTGKSQIAAILAQELAVKCHEALGQSITCAADLNALLLSARDGEIVFVDEAHELQKLHQTALYLAIDKRQVIVCGSKTVQAIPLANFCLLLGTTDEFSLLQPLRDRMKLVLRFQFYGVEELTQIVRHRAKALGWGLDDAVPNLIGQRARGTPRLALRLLAAARRVSRSLGEQVITLDHAHQQGFIHRDIKPANILLDSHGQPYLTDFGIAATREELRVARTASVGTLAYMSPEQVLGQPVDARSDTCSLGIVLFEMLTGHRPFSGRNSRDLREQVLSATPTFVDSQAQVIPAALEQVCMKCLQREPRQRYAAASSLAAALRESLSNNARRSHRRLYFVGAMMLVLLIGFGAVGFSLRQHGGVSLPGSSERPTETQNHLASGTVLFNHQEFRQAAAEFTEAIHRDPRLMAAFQRRAACHFNLGELQQAMSDLAHVLENDPKNAEAYKLRALANTQLGLFDKALSDARDALRFDPANAESSKNLLALIYHARATDHNNHFRWSEALADASDMIRLQPGNAEAYAVRGTIYFNMRDFDRAVADFNKTIELEPNNPKRHKQRSDSLRGAGRLDEAKADEEKASALQRKPQTGGSLEVRAN
jgi:Holliday junction resolvasome RuvABC ATP-dependent DNA helicase subunit/tetratricopeptide (TPR) repeat protein